MPIEIEQLLSSLTPEESTTPKLQLSTPIYTIKLSSIQGEFEGQNVHSLLMIGHTKRAIANYEDPIALLLGTRIIIELTSGKTSIFQLKESSYKEQLTFYNLLLANQGTAEFAFTGYGHQGKGSWSIYTINEIYDTQEVAFYAHLHKAIAEELVEKISSDPTMKVRAKLHGIQLFSIGCGLGDDLFVCSNAIKSLGIDCESLGLDVNYTNIKHAETNYPALNFIELDIRFHKLIPKIFNVFKLHEHKLKIVISSGSLTRSVMNGAYSVATVLQDIQTVIKADWVIIAGRTSPIITEAIASSIGYSSQLKQVVWDGETPEDLTVNKFNHNVYVLSKISPCEQYEQIKRKSILRSNGEFKILDLSLSPSPLELIKAFITSNTISEITQVDLSWSYVKDEKEEIADLIKALQQFPRLEAVLFSNCEAWALTFCLQVYKLNCFGIKKRLDCSDHNELPTLSIPLAKTLGLYDDVPQEEDFKPKPPAPRYSPRYFEPARISAIEETLFSTCSLL